MPNETQSGGKHARLRHHVKKSAFLFIQAQRVLKLKKCILKRKKVLVWMWPVTQLMPSTVWKVRGHRLAAGKLYYLELQHPTQCDIIMELFKISLEPVFVLMWAAVISATSFIMLLLWEQHKEAQRCMNGAVLIVQVPSAPCSENVSTDVVYML